MSGTSLDGIDLAYCQFEARDGKWSFGVECAETVPLEEKWVARLMGLPEQSAEIFAKTNVYFGHYLGQVVRDFIQRNGLKPQFVASHGQTIFHQPQKNFTGQIGDGESMVSYLPCPLVTNFRNKDVAMGGQGAPLVPFGEKHLFPDYRLFLNLGGFANLTADGRAWDVAACNLVLNTLARMENPEWGFDHDGQMARTGKIIPSLLQSLNQIPYYAQSPPKSLGTEWLMAEVMPLLLESNASPADISHTYVHHLSDQIAAAIESTGISDAKLLVTGGGAHHTFLMERLADVLGPLGVAPDSSVSPQIVAFKEAIIFAFLGLMTLLGKPNTLASVTGASLDVCGGSIHLPPGGGWSLLGANV